MKKVFEKIEDRMLDKIDKLMLKDKYYVIDYMNSTPVVKYKGESFNEAYEIYEKSSQNAKLEWTACNKLTGADSYGLTWMKRKEVA